MPFVHRAETKIFMIDETLKNEVIIKRLRIFNELGKLHNPKYLIYAITGGRGGGKTKQVALNLLIVGAECKKRIVGMRETWTTIEESSYQEFVDFINAGMDSYGWRYNKTEIWNINSGSTIKFRGMLDRNTSSRESLKGLANVDIFWIDEAQSVTTATLDVFIPLVRKKGSCAIFTFNKIKKRLPVWECLFLDNPPPDTFFLQVNYTDHLDNPEARAVLTESFIARAEHLKRECPEKYKRDYLNQPDTQAEVNVVRYWSDKNIKPVNYIPDIDMHITCDFNRSPNCWELVHRTEHKYFFFDEFCKDKETADLIKDVLDKYPHPGRIVINGDASGKQGKAMSGGDILPDYIIIENELKKRGYRLESRKDKHGKLYRFDIRPGNGSRKARFSAWNSKVIDENGVICIYADPKCKYLDLNCRELKIIPGTSEYDTPTKSEIATDPELRFLEHPFDAASYIVNTYHPITAYYPEREQKDLTPLEMWNKRK